MDDSDFEIPKFGSRSEMYDDWVHKTIQDQIDEIADLNECAYILRGIYRTDD